MRPYSHAHVRRLSAKVNLLASDERPYRGAHGVVCFKDHGHQLRTAWHQSVEDIGGYGAVEPFCPEAVELFLSPLVSTIRRQPNDKLEDLERMQMAQTILHG